MSVPLRWPELWEQDPIYKKRQHRGEPTQAFFLPCARHWSLPQTLGL